MCSKCEFKTCKVAKSCNSNKLMQRKSVAGSQSSSEGIRTGRGVPGHLCLSRFIVAPSTSVCSIEAIRHWRRGVQSPSVITSKRVRARHRPIHGAAVGARAAAASPVPMRLNDAPADHQARVVKLPCQSREEGERRGGAKYPFVHVLTGHVLVDLIVSCYEGLVSRSDGILVGSR
jgi:hypothetical protein